MNSEIEPCSQADSTDLDHLRLLSIFHYIVAGISALFACFPLIHFGLGLFMLAAPQQFGPPHNQPPVFLGLFLMAFAGFIIALGWGFAMLVFLSGRFIALKRHYNFCFVVACVECIFMPFGTVLGVFTILVLSQRSVKELFNPKTAA